MAVELARDAGTWICGECREENVAADQEEKNPDTEVTSGARQSRGLKIIQWNCDWMATKVDELAGLVREKPDVVVLQETKLREGDPTPHIERYVVTRFDRKTRRPLAAARGGGLAVMMREGIAHWTEKHRGTSALEALIVNIPTGGRQGRLRIINIYIPPSGNTELKEREREVEDLKRLPKGRNVIWCGDFNAHHPQWDPNREDDMGERLVELFLEEGLTTVNSGEATWYARRDKGSPRTAPDITVEWASEDMTTEWSVLHRLSSDHLPISIEWKKEYEREKEREVRPNLAKVDKKWTKVEK